MYIHFIRMCLIYNNSPLARSWQWMVLGGWLSLTVETGVTFVTRSQHRFAQQYGQVSNVIHTDSHDVQMRTSVNMGTNSHRHWARPCFYLCRIMESLNLLRYLLLRDEELRSTVSWSNLIVIILLDWFIHKVDDRLLLSSDRCVGGTVQHQRRLP